MATVRIASENRTLTHGEEICAYLSEIGIRYEQWKPAHQIAERASTEQVLAAYAHEIERLKAEGGYVTADVIDVLPTTPGLDAMLNRFNREHWHNEDEVLSSSKAAGFFIFIRAKEK
jgi:1,2-dihydroxy-3-keto-5-methylthiopentene dioxygenase